MNKVKTVVDAISALGITIPDASGFPASQAIVAMRDFAGIKRGFICSGSSVSSNQYWSVICDIEEFNQCVKEMSLHNVTQEQFDAYVAADKEVLKPVFDEWSWGDECVYDGFGAIFIGEHPSYPLVVIDSSEHGLIEVFEKDLSRPETQQQKAARERSLFITECSRLMHETNESELNDITIGALFDAGVRLPIGEENAI